jgi:hypothetical protein
MLSGGIDLGYTDPTSMVSPIAAGAQLVKDVPKPASLRCEDIANPTLIQKLDKSGFIDGLYK